MSTTPAVWTRQAGESPVAWAAFVAYRDAAGRSLAKVGQQLGKSTDLLERWSARWAWSSRVAAWEAEQDRDWTAEILRERRLVARRHLDTAALLIEKALARLDGIDVNALTPRELLEYLKAGMEIEARIYGLDAEPVGAHSVVRIMLDPRLLPPGAELPAAERART